MQEESTMRGPSPSESIAKGSRISGDTNPNGCGGKYSLEDPESFYEKLSNFFQSCGLNLVINVQKTILDLHLFYREVTQRGGFHQVTKDETWDKIVSALKLEGGNANSAAQLQRLYAHLLYQFEQIYNYRTSATPDCSTMKHKSWNSLTPLTDFEELPVKIKMSNHNCNKKSKGSRTAEQKLVLPMPLDNKPMKRGPGCRRGVKTAYHIFLKKECCRLKSIYGKSLGGKSIRNWANEGWRHLSESEREPYIEESRKYKLEMATSKQNESVHDDTTEHKTPNSCENEPLKTDGDGDYHVTLEPDAQKLCVKSTVELGVEMMKDAPKYTIYHDMNSEEYSWPLDIAVEESREL
ncbi:ARID domain-containing protein [Cephalotus follicularis]|uniref:ARID domain-containing protein n=1 Tax=Cephalotus follicularis TaxID=3775 RepID=A0A1Q3DI24_CEPFO|nr:ARID domain-containing protein [Cephalotus follicularis]